MDASRPKRLNLTSKNKRGNKRDLLWDGYEKGASGRWTSKGRSITRDF